MGLAVKKSAKYYNNYATLKSRGVIEKLYTLTVHKMPVKMGGFEYSDEKENRLNDLRDKVHNGFIVNDDGVKRFDASLLRSRNTVIQYVANNEWDYFCTFTLRRKDVDFDVYDLKQTSKKVLTFFKNYSNRSGLDTGFKYVLIPEFHKDDAVHFHGVVKGLNSEDLEINKNGHLDFVPYREAFGFCSVDKIRDLNKCASYISKYVSKDMFLDFKFKKGMHMFYASKGLNKDDIIMVGEPVVSVREFLENGYESFENEYCTKIMSSDLSVFEGCIVEFGKKFRQGVNIPRASRKDVVKKAYEIVPEYTLNYLHRFRGLDDNTIVKRAVGIVNRHEEKNILDYEYYSKKYKEMKKSGGNTLESKPDLMWYEDSSDLILYEPIYECVSLSEPEHCSIEAIAEYEQISILEGNVS